MFALRSNVKDRMAVVRTAREMYMTQWVHMSSENAYITSLSYMPYGVLEEGSTVWG